MVEGLCNYHASKLEHVLYHHSTTAQIDAYSSMHVCHSQAKLHQKKKAVAAVVLGCLAVSSMFGAKLSFQEVLSLF